MAELDAEARLIFLSLMDRSEEEWPNALDELCADRPELRVVVERLLANHIALRTMSLDENQLPTGAHDEIGSVIAGNYKLLELLGEGGFGIVYLAEQTAPVRRKVAIKLLKAGMDTRHIIARFEAERQALAIMDHPNIARVFDGGVTQNGRPFFVMEYVKGTPITEFCDEHRLTTRQRLELFVFVCQAVQHAHQKGIIHRDIKPSNVLVSRHDTTPVVKVIDFGIAKALGQELTDKTLHTGVEQMIGTPLYMSPEQAGMSDLDVDTRSDIYSLGVLLYELLTGTTPFSRARFKKAAYDEIRRIIREEEPPKPSTRIAESTETLPSVAASRGVEPKKLGSLVRGELDWIVMKALEKDRNRRYETANGFAADVLRYLSGEAVSAVPPSTAYRLRKFVRRHKAKVVAASLILTLLFSGIAGTSWGYLHAEKRRLEAEEARKDMEAAKNRAEEAEALTLADYRASTDLVMERLIGSKPELNEDEQVYIRSTLDRWKAFANRQSEASTAMAFRGEGHFRVANLWFHLGKFDLSLQEFRAAVDCLERFVSEHPDPDGRYRIQLVEAHTSVGRCLHQFNEHSEAMNSFKEADRILFELTTAYPGNVRFRHQLAIVADARAQLASATSKHIEAIAFAKKAVDGYKKLVTEFPDNATYHLHLAIILITLGAQLSEIGDRDAGVKHHLEAADILEKLTKQYPRRVEYGYFYAKAIAATGQALRHAGKLHESSARYLQAIAIAEELARKYPSVAMYPDNWAGICTNHAIVLVELDRGPEAEQQYRKALAVRKRLVDDNPQNVKFQRDLAISHNNLGSSMERRGRAAEAIEQFQSALAIQERLIKENPNLASLRHELAQTYGSLCLAHGTQTRYPESLEFGRKSLEIKKRLVVELPDVKIYRLDLANQFLNLGLMLLGSGDIRAALQHLDEAYATILPLLNADSRDARTRRAVDLIHAARAKCQHRARQYNEAVAELDKSLLYCRALDRPAREVSRAIAMAKCGRMAEAVAEADRLTKVRSLSGPHLYDLACVYSLAVGADQPNKEAFAIRAIEVIRESMKAGFTPIDHIKRDSDLRPLHGREDFKRLLEELDAKSSTKKKDAAPKQDKRSLSH